MTGIAYAMLRTAKILYSFNLIYHNIFMELSPIMFELAILSTADQNAYIKIVVTSILNVQGYCFYRQ